MTERFFAAPTAPGGKGELLLLRSVAVAASEEDVLYDLLWSRAFTGK
jgi:hypothetical protein